MSRRVLNAHTGDCLLVDLDACQTFEDLRRWIAGNTGIAERKQVLLTPKGKQVKTHSLRAQEDVFVYDRDIIQGSPGSRQQSTPPVERLRYSYADPPQGQPRSDEDVPAWSGAASARKEWIGQFQSESQRAIDDARRIAANIAVIQQGTAIAAENLKQHLASLKQRQHQAQDWVESLLLAQANFQQERGHLEHRLSLVPATGKLQRFLKLKGRPLSSRSPSSLADLISFMRLEELAPQAAAVSERLRLVLEDINAGVGDLVTKGDAIMNIFSRDFVSSTGDLLEILDNHAQEQSVLCKKIFDDCQDLLQNRTTDLSRYAKTFTRHDKNIIPPLLDTFADTGSIVTQLHDRKNQLVRSATDHMCRISAAESALGNVTQDFSRLNLSSEDDNVLESLDMIYRLPSVYGSLMIECIRRREWMEKMTSDSTSLAEEMATYRDDEERRRKRWLKSIAYYLGEELSSDVMGIDVSLRSADNDIPTINRNDATAYIEALRNAGGFDDSVQELGSALQSIDEPSRQQTKRANAFRNGSVADQPFGRNSLLLRGDDELIRSLQLEKSRLEERLKGSDSRVRKLEDLLHRQSQIHSRPSSRGVSGNYPFDRISGTPIALDGFSKVPVQAQSPGGFTPPRSSLVAQFQEQNPSNERVAQLEANLQTEKAKTAKLEASVATNAEKEAALRTEMQEATDLKRDLLENFQTQQNEFEAERRLLEEENRKMKIKLEEMEEDFDRILGSHDNARLGLDERTRALEQELRSYKDKAAEDLQKFTSESDRLREEQGRLLEELEDAKQRLAETLELKQQSSRRIDILEDENKSQREFQIGHKKSLQAIHAQLAVDSLTPNDFTELTDALMQLSVKAIDHQQELQQALERAKLENNSQVKQLEARSSENKQLKSRFDHAELEVFALREEVADRKARYSSLETELEYQRQDLEVMRTKYSESDNFAQVLRERLNVEEKKTSELTANQSNIQSRNTQAENDLSRLNERVDILEAVRSKQAAQLEARASRCEDVSSLLLAQNQSLLGLMSQIGFTATFQNGTYVFERTSRLANGGSSLVEVSPAISRVNTNTEGSTGNRHPDPKLSQWASLEDGNEKDLFEQYMAEIRALDMDSLYDTLTNRFKDVERVARKWQREAKNYRERYHRAQFEAQSKIAFRNFREGDLALFLPTRNQAPKRSWAAFNVGAPHYFLREQEYHTLKSRDWLVARISKVEERVVDLSKAIGSNAAINLSREGVNAADETASSMLEDDNPFDLSDGLRWYYLDAAEERLGAAPTTPGLGKSTVASAPEHATGSSILAAKTKPGEANVAAKVLTKSLDSRRSSTNSKKSTAGAMASPANAIGTFDTGHGEGSAAAAAVAAAGSSASGGGGGLGIASASERSSLRRPGSRESTAAAAATATTSTSPPRSEQRWSSLWSVDVGTDSGRKG